MVTIKNNIWSIVSIIVMAVAFFVGVYGRIKGNGLWPFSGDEYLVAQSVNHILQYGAPSFECGGYYQRGLLIQYILAATSFIPGLSLEMKYRSIIAIFNLLALPGLYLLANRVAGRKVAIGAIVFFCLSIWEIEFSRYARMYVPFQTIFIWYLYLLFLVMFDGKLQLLKIMWTLSFVSIFVYEGAIFLCILNFMPWLCKKSHKPVFRDLAFPLIILVSATSFNLVDWRSIGAAPRYSDGFEFKQAVTVKQVDISIPKTIGPVMLPTNVLGLFIFDSLWSYATLLLGLVAIAITYRLMINSQLGINERLILLIAVALALINQFSLMFLTVSIAWFIGFASLEKVNRRQLIGLSSIIFSILVFWVIFGISSQSWYELFPTQVEQPWYKLLVVFFKYPDIYTKIITPWLAGQPSTTILYLSVILLAVPVAIINKKLHVTEKSLLGIILLMCTLVAMLSQPYVESKYTFFIYPLVIITVLISVLRICEFVLKDNEQAVRKTYLIFCVIIMLLADDYSLKHILSVDSLETNFRLDYSRGREHHLWRKFESRSAALYVNEHAKHSDVIMSTVRPAHFYLDRLDYFFFDRYVGEIMGVMACGGEKENWTSANLIYEVKHLLDKLESRGHRIWLLAYNPSNQRARQSDKLVAEHYKGNAVYQSQDNSVIVYMIIPQAEY